MPIGPSVSIVVDSYNHEAFIREAIDSALAQDYANKEVIVIDDGSTDHSRKIIESYGDRVQAAFQANRGQVAACGQGFLLTQNDIIMFLDSDDVLAPNAVSQVVSHWAPNVSKVQFSLQSIDRNGRPISTVFPKYPDGLTPEKIRSEVLKTSIYHAPTTSGNAFARSYLSKVLPISEAFAGDIDDALNVAAPLFGDVITVPEVLGYYRVHDANQSGHSELTAERFEKYVNDSVERASFLRLWCDRLDISLQDDVVERDFSFQEHRLAAAAVGRKTRFRLVWPTLRAIGGSGLSGRQKIFHSLWSLAVGLGPLALAKELLIQRFVFTKRSGLIERLLGGSTKATNLQATQ